MRLSLKYYDRDGKRTGVIEGIRRVSTPGRRIYADKDAIPKVCGGYGIAILSTNQGIMTGHQCRATASAAKCSARSGNPRSGGSEPCRALARSRSASRPG